MSPLDFEYRAERVSDQIGDGVVFPLDFDFPISLPSLRFDAPVLQRITVATRSVVDVQKELVSLLKRVHVSYGNAKGY